MICSFCHLLSHTIFMHFVTQLTLLFCFIPFSSKVRCFLIGSLFDTPFSCLGLTLHFIVRSFDLIVFISMPDPLMCLSLSLHFIIKSVNVQRHDASVLLFISLSDPSMCKDTMPQSYSSFHHQIRQCAKTRCLSLSLHFIIKSVNVLRQCAKTRCLSLLFISSSNPSMCKDMMPQSTLHFIVRSVNVQRHDASVLLFISLSDSSTCKDMMPRSNSSFHCQIGQCAKTRCLNLTLHFIVRSFNMQKHDAARSSLRCTPCSTASLFYFLYTALSKLTILMPVAERVLRTSQAVCLFPPHLYYIFSALSTPFSDRLVRACSELPKLCAFFHIPFQSGDNDILREMKRGYTHER